MTPSIVVLSYIDERESKTENREWIGDGGWDPEYIQKLVIGMAEIVAKRHVIRLLHTMNVESSAS
jgi:hypothetical protein